MKIKLATIGLLLIASCWGAFGQQIGKDDMAQIQQRLDSILATSDTLPRGKKHEINRQVWEIKQLLSRLSVQAPAYRTYTDPEALELTERLKKMYTFDDQQILLNRAVVNTRFTMSQIRYLLGAVAFQDDKRAAAAILVPVALDPENIDQLFDMFWTKSDKQYINGLIPKRIEQ